MPDVTPERATRLIRFAAWATGFAVVVWFALAWISSEIRVLRAQSPWSDDPPDLFVSLAVLIVGFVGLLTFVRVQRHARLAVMPAATADDALRGLIVALGVTAIAEAAQVAAALDGAHRADWGPATLWLGIWLVASMLAVVLAAVLTWVAAVRTAAWRRAARAESRDAFDDIIGWVLELGESPIPRRLGAGRLQPLARWLARGLDTWPFSPRRHRWLFALVVATAFGTAFSASHLIAEGPPPGIGQALFVWAIYGAFGAAAVLGGWVAFGSYLRLVRRA
ncbi:MAG TPA: hypothetical protein VIP52_07200 [Candidatus Dormibacteraeota bacterium]|jgi:hypothetical protein